MIIYTTMPEDKIFEGLEAYRPAYVDLTINGIDMQVEMIGSRQAKIVRLHSAVPADYMNPKYAPGTVIEFQPVLK